MKRTAANQTKLRLQELRAFLEKKGLSPWGVKAALVARIDEYYARRFYS